MVTAVAAVTAVEWGGTLLHAIQQTLVSFSIRVGPVSIRRYLRIR